MSTLELPALDPPEPHTTLTQSIATDTHQAGQWVTDANGNRRDISAWTYKELLEFQCEQEPLFARAIEAAEKGSDTRREITQLAYTTICTVLARMTVGFPDANTLTQEDSFAMGMDPRYSDLILRVLAQQKRAGIEGGLFEVGFSAGVLLQQVAAAGFDVGGLEVVDDLRQQAKAKLHPKHHSQLLVGDFCKLDLSEHVGRYSVVYWNDVFEHIPTDEIVDYVKVIYSLLAPGGKLVTITPNWHMRPSDVTDAFKPPRSEAVGFHLKEYSAREVCDIVREAGFSSVETPLYISRKRIYFSGIPGLTALKNALEPLLEWLPYPVAVQCCRRFGLNCTVSTK